MILQFPNDQLYIPSEVIKDFDLNLKKLAQEMLKITKEEKAVGLAAVQIGIHKQIFVMLIKDKEYAFCNPKITKQSGTQEVLEGCLSERGNYITKTRPMNIVIEYQDIYGSKKRKAFSGLAAQCCVHEYSHLLGRRPLND